MTLASLARIGLVQMAVEPGRPDRNVERMLSWIARARERQAEVVVFSEMCVPGYIVGDLWETPRVGTGFGEVDATVEESATRRSRGTILIFSRISTVGIFPRSETTHLCNYVFLVSCLFVCLFVIRNR